MISYGWAAFGGLVLWGIGVSMGIKHQLRESKRATLLGIKSIASSILKQGLAQGMVGKVRVVDEHGRTIHEESADIPTEGPPKH